MQPTEPNPNQPLHAPDHEVPDQRDDQPLKVINDPDEDKDQDGTGQKRRPTQPQDDA